MVARCVVQTRRRSCSVTGTHNNTHSDKCQVRGRKALVSKPHMHTDAWPLSEPQQCGTIYLPCHQRDRAHAILCGVSKPRSDDTPTAHLVWGQACVQIRSSMHDECPNCGVSVTTEQNTPMHTCCCCCAPHRVIHAIVAVCDLTEHIAHQ